MNDLQFIIACLINGVIAFLFTFKLIEYSACKKTFDKKDLKNLRKPVIGLGILSIVMILVLIVYINIFY